MLRELCVTYIDTGSPLPVRNKEAAKSNGIDAI